MNILRLLFSFFGRINRARYWLGLGMVYAFFAAAMALWAFLPPSDNVSFIVGLGVMCGLVSLLSIISKRLHDLSITAWWVPVMLVVLALIIAPRIGPADTIASIVICGLIIWLGCQKGTSGPNRHGPDSLEQLA